jgi:hypothetical protein
MENYGAARKWIRGVGPSGPPLAPFVESGGVATVDSEDAAEASARLEGPIREWIAARLGLDSAADVALRAARLAHYTVRDVYGVRTRGLLLWEVVAADTIEFSVQRRAGEELDLETVAAGLEKAAPEGARLHVERARHDAYRIASSSPLVFAIRVVETQYEVASPEPTPFHLTEPYRGRPQPARFGYEVTYVGGLDPVARTFEARIRNADFPGARSVPHTFREDEEWVNEDREAIGAADPRARRFDYVRDTIQVLWRTDLDDCLLRTVRQYQRVRTARSGLKGVR